MFCKILYIFFFLVSVHSSFAGLSEYLARMDSEGRPRTLIVGCGHMKGGNPQVKGDHTHPHAWCVNIKDSLPYSDTPSYSISSESLKSYLNNLEEDWKSLQADDELDITSFLLPPEYKNAFDVVVLERIWSKPLNHKNTLFNAASMLKVGGDLVVDIHTSYSFWLYNSREEDTVLNSINPLGTLDDDEVFSIRSIEASFLGERHTSVKELSKEHKAKLELFGVNFRYRLTRETDLEGIGIYLANCGFKDILTPKLAHQPWTVKEGEDIKTGREGALLIATKSVTTEKIMKTWKNQVAKFKG